MSSSLSIYIGPYISCVVRMMKKPINVRVCSNDRCRILPLSDARFCSACGSKIIVVERMVDDSVDFADVVGEDVFVSLHSDGHRGAGSLFLGSNLVEGPWGRKLHYDGDADEEHVDLEVDRQAEMRAFEKNYAEEIGKLRKSFDDVRIGWGMHLYYT